MKTLIRSAFITFLMITMVACDAPPSEVPPHTQLQEMLQQEANNRSGVLELATQYASVAAQISTGTPAEIDAAKAQIEALKAEHQAALDAHRPPLDAAEEALKKAKEAEAAFHTVQVFYDEARERARTVCGEDGCGEICGTCELNELCHERYCRCIPQCLDKTCGDNGCGGSCGACADAERCTEEGACAAIIQDKTETVTRCVGNCATGQSRVDETTRVVDRAPTQRHHAAKVQSSRLAGPLTSSAALESYLGALNGRIRTNQGYSADEAQRLAERIAAIDVELPLARQRAATASDAVREATSAIAAVTADAKKKRAAAESGAT